MEDDKPISPFIRKFIGFCDAEAERITSELVKDLANRNVSLSKDDARFVAWALSDELAHFFWHAIKTHIDDPEGLKRLNRVSSKIAARKSAAKRFTGSTKRRFLEFALEQNRRNPTLSKGAVAEMFARENPGTSVSTLRRYLAAIPNEGDD
ncbi:MAG: hypothetical protein JNM58_17075 [Xanthomonadaceae bacterium]|nr:hypothetical protein [Xanthomonadaceae bacterium]